MLALESQKRIKQLFKNSPLDSKLYVTSDYTAYFSPRAGINCVTTIFNVKNLKEKSAIGEFLNSLNRGDWFVTTVNPP